MQLRLATFNAENLDLGDDVEPGWEARAAVLRPQIEALRADVLCLQEVNAQKTGPGPRTFAALDRLVEGTPYAGYYRATSAMPPSGRPSDRHNLATLSRWPFAGVRQLMNDLVDPPLWRPATAEPEVEEAEPVIWDRPVLATTIAVEGAPAPLHVVNVHFRAPLASALPGGKVGPFAWKSVESWAEGYFLAAVKRAGQALEVRRLVDELLREHQDALIAVAGDFNAEEAESACRLVAGAPGDTGNAALEGLALTPVSRVMPEHRRYSVIHAGRRELVDHVFASRALIARLADARIANEALEDELVAETLHGASAQSHHAPVVAEFDLG